LKINVINKSYNAQVDQKMMEYLWSTNDQNSSLVLIHNYHDNDKFKVSHSSNKEELKGTTYHITIHLSTYFKILKVKF